MIGLSFEGRSLHASPTAAIRLRTWINDNEDALQCSITSQLGEDLGENVP